MSKSVCSSCSHIRHTEKLTRAFTLTSARCFSSDHDKKKNTFYYPHNKAKLRQDFTKQFETLFKQATDKLPRAVKHPLKTIDDKLKYAWTPTDQNWRRNDPNNKISKKVEKFVDNRVMPGLKQLKSSVKKGVKDKKDKGRDTCRQISRDVEEVYGMGDVIKATRSGCGVAMERGEHFYEKWCPRFLKSFIYREFRGIGKLPTEIKGELMKKAEGSDGRWESNSEGYSHSKGDRGRFTQRLSDAALSTHEKVESVLFDRKAPTTNRFQGDKYSQFKGAFPRFSGEDLKHHPGVKRQRIFVTLFMLFGFGIFIVVGVCGPVYMSVKMSKHQKQREAARKMEKEFEDELVT